VTLVRDEGVAGSNPATPTIFLSLQKNFGQLPGQQRLGWPAASGRPPTREERTALQTRFSPVIKLLGKVHDTVSITPRTVARTASATGGCHERGRGMADVLR
jgi:hypothetical protein